MDDAVTLDPVEQSYPPQNPPRPKQLVRFVSGYCQAKNFDTLDCDFSRTLEQALQCIENTNAAEK